MPAFRALLLPLAVVALLACNRSNDPADEPGTTPERPGKSASPEPAADFRVFGWGYGRQARGHETGGLGSRGGEIAEPWGEGRTVALNGYRGLQVLDHADPEAPRRVGEVRWQGEPVALFVDGNRALAVVDQHAGVRAEGGMLRQESGGRVYAVDLSEPARPVVTAEMSLPFRAGFAARTGDGLVVSSSACNGSPCDTWLGALLRFAWSGNRLTETARIPIDGSVVPHVEGDRLVLARSAGPETDTTWLSIAELLPDGGISVGRELALPGRIDHVPPLDLEGDVLRVVLGASAEAGTSSALATVDVSAQPSLIDSALVDGRYVYDVAFSGDRVIVSADVPTIFDIDAAGAITPRAPLEDWPEYGVTPECVRLLEDGRLLLGGIRERDGSYGGSAVSVALYDVANGSRLGSFAMSDESFDAPKEWHLDRCHLDERRGVLFVPWLRRYQYNWDDFENVPGFDLFAVDTSEPTLLAGLERAAGVPLAGDADRVSFVSAAELQTWDIAAAERMITLPLAHRHAAILPLGDFVVRHAERPDARGGARLEVLSRADAADEWATPIASIAVVPGGRALPVGERLIAWAWFRGVHGDGSGQVEIGVQLIDFSTPESPRGRGRFVTTLDTVPFVHALDHALVVAEPVRLLDERPVHRVCTRTPRERGTCEASAREDGCTQIVGAQRCGAAGPCAGGFASCTWNEAGAAFSCSPIDAAAFDVEETCFEEADWTHSGTAITVLDLSNPDEIQRRAAFTLPDDAFLSSMVPQAEGIWVTYAAPASKPDASRPLLRYTARYVEPGLPAEPKVGDPLDLPGALVGIDGDAFVMRRDVWEADGLRSRLVTGRAGATAVSSESELPLPAITGSIVRAAEGRWLVSTIEPWLAFGSAVDVTEASRTLLAVADGKVDATYEVPAWAELRAVAAGRALCATSDGMLAWDLERDAAAGFLRTEYWDGAMLEAPDGSLVVPQGSWGLGVLPPLE